jgi:hypothetical protein
LPAEYNGNHFFEFPPALVDIKAGHARKLYVMDKHFDGHTWCQSNTRNIQNEFDLSFRVSRCVEHMRCDNSNCEYLTREGRHDSVNEKLWDGHAKIHFLGQALHLIMLLFAIFAKFLLHVLQFVLL